MPVSIDDYFQKLLETVSESPAARSSDLAFDKRSDMVGFVRGNIFFVDHSVLHIRELIDLRRSPICVMYAYHYQNANGEMIFRYDNTGHYPDLPNQPHHKHIASGVIPVPGELPNLNTVLAEISGQIAPPPK